MLAAALLATGALLHGTPARRAACHASPVMSGAYDYSCRDLRTGAVQPLDAYEGKVSLIVNVASK